MGREPSRPQKRMQSPDLLRSPPPSLPHSLCLTLQELSGQDRGVLAGEKEGDRELTFNWGKTRATHPNEPHCHQAS